MRESAKETIKGYLRMAEERLNLEHVDDTDLEKVREHIKNAEEELEKELE